MDLGAPIGSTRSSYGTGGGIGQSDFNAGTGGAHASGDIPRGTPIADRFSGSGNTSDVYGSSGKLDNALDNYDGQRGETVSGAYAGGSTRDGLTGQTGHSTGAGVGPLAENLHGSSGEHHHHHHHHQHGAGAIVGGTGAAGLAGREEYEQAYGHSSGAATSTAPLSRGEGVAGLGQGLVPGVGGGNGSSGIGPAGDDGAYTESRREPGYGNLGAGAAGVGAGAAGVGAGELYSSGHRNDNYDNQGSSGNGAKIAEGGLSGSGGNGVNEPGTGGGKYGRAETDSSSGKPISNPKDLDTGNSHSLVYDEASGKYVHRRDLTGQNKSSRA